MEVDPFKLRRVLSNKKGMDFLCDSEVLIKRDLSIEDRQLMGALLGMVIGWPTGSMGCLS